MRAISGFSAKGEPAKRTCCRREFLRIIGGQAVFDTSEGGKASKRAWELDGRCSGHLGTSLFRGHVMDKPAKRIGGVLRALASHWWIGIFRGGYLGDKLVRDAGICVLLGDEDVGGLQRLADVDIALQNCIIWSKI